MGRTVAHIQENLMQTRNANQKDAKRIGVWLGVVIGLLVIGATIFNVYWYKTPPANIDDQPPAVQPSPAPEKPPGS